MTRVPVNVPQELYDRWRKASYETHVSMSALAREALELSLAPADRTPRTDEKPPLKDAQARGPSLRGPAYPERQVKTDFKG